MELKFDPAPDGTYSKTAGGQTVTIVKPSTLAGSLNSFDFTATYPVLGVIVKDGVDGANVYDYSPDGSTGDTYLTTPFDGDKGISHISFCYVVPEFVPPQVTKTAVGTYDRTVTWELEKFVNEEGEKLAEYEGFAGDTFPTNWLIFVTKTEVESNFKVTGSITIENLNDFALDFTVADVLDDSTVAVVTCPSYTVPAKDSVVCTYEAFPAGRTATQNTATVTVQDKGDVVATADVSFTETLIGFDSGTLTDDRFPAFSEIVTETDDFTLPQIFECSTDPGDYTDGEYTDTFDNTAYLNGNLNLEDDASVEIICTLPALEIEKTAEGSFDRTVEWDLEKYVNVVGLKLDEYEGLPGDSFPTDWLIFVTKTEEIDNFLVEGTITIYNPAAVTQIVTGVTDVLDDGTPATVDCGEPFPIDIEAGEYLVCDYEAVPMDDSAELNTATVSAVGNDDIIATAEVEFEENLIGFDQGTLTDDRIATFSEIVTGTDDFTLSETFYCPPSGSVLYVDGIYYEEVVNTAHLNEDIDLTDFAEITIYCEDYGKKSGYKWDDLNADGIWNPMEPILSGWTIHLIKLADSSVTPAVTNAEGYYEFDMVLPGVDYVVCEVLEAGYYQSFPSTGYDCTQFGLGYGPVGYLINLMPGEHKANNNFGNYKPMGCTYTQGYWKTHSMYGPAGPYDPTWDLKAGGDAVFLDAANPKNSFTWYSMFWTPPARGNAYIILAHQYMAAWLNENNVDPLKAASTAVLGTALADAYELLKYYNPYDVLEPAVREQFIALASFLDMYNNGELPGGPPHCD